MPTRDQYVASMKEKLDEWNRDIDELEKSLAKARDGVSQEVKSQLSQAKENYASLRSKIEEIRNHEQGSWEGLKDEAEHVWKALRQSANYLRSQL